MRPEPGVKGALAARQVRCRSAAESADELVKFGDAIAGRRVGTGTCEGEARGRDKSGSNSHDHNGPAVHFGPPDSVTSFSASGFMLSSV